MSTYLEVAGRPPAPSTIWAADEYDPSQPDLALLCRDGQVVQAHAYLLMLASQPLVPAIKLALAEGAWSCTSKTGSSQPSGLSTLACPAAASSASRVSSASSASSGSPWAGKVPAGMAVCKVEQDSAEAWRLLLQFLDPNQLHRPDITWDNVEPLLLLSHKYNVKVPLKLCQDFLSQGLQAPQYLELPTAQLTHLPRWLAITRQLYLHNLHASVMTCLAHNLERLSMPATKAKAGFGAPKPQISLFSDPDDDDNAPFSLFDPVNDDDARESTASTAAQVFEAIWGVTVACASDDADAVRGQVTAALMQQLVPEEAVELLMALVTRDYMASRCRPH